MMMYHHKISFVAKDQQFKRYNSTCHILIIYWTLTLKIANQPFCTTLQLMMMHHHAAKSGYKSFISSEDIVWTNTLQF